MTNDEKAMLRADAIMDQAVECLKGLATSHPEPWRALGDSLADGLAEINRHPLPLAPVDQSEFERCVTLMLAFYAHHRITGLLIGRSV